MGVLDDAIREHLDLKRRHGAAEDEVARQEAEALGPARREAPTALDEPADAGGPLHVDPVDDVAPPPPVHDIDEDPLAPPPPVAGAPIDGEPTEPAPPADYPPGDSAATADPGATVEYDALRDEPGDPQPPHSDH